MIKLKKKQGFIKILFNKSKVYNKFKKENNKIKQKKVFKNLN